MFQRYCYNKFCFSVLVTEERIFLKNIFNDRIDTSHSKDLEALVMVLAMNATTFLVQSLSPKG